MAAILAAAPATATENTAAVPPVAPRTFSIKDSPGYVQLVDPESTSVRLGRRPNAPLVRMPFMHGASSLNDLGRAVCRALERGTRDSLRLLTLAEDEFRVILWPEFPQSRPATGLTWEDGWRVLNARLLNGTAGAWQDHGGQPYECVGIEKNESVAYKNFTLHNGVTIVARNAAGEMERFGWVRSVAERKGKFKIYSMRD
jgi:hypothetical protein